MAQPGRGEPGLAAWSLNDRKEVLVTDSTCGFHHDQADPACAETTFPWEQMETI